MILAGASTEDEAETNPAQSNKEMDNLRSGARIPLNGCVPNGYGDPNETNGNQRNDRG
jgi:hypothetical protein